MRVNNRSLIQQRPQKQTHGQPDTLQPSHHHGPQPQPASAPRTGSFILKAVRRRGKRKRITAFGTPATVQKSGEPLLDGENFPVILTQTSGIS